jgi:hypothetical protein
VAVILSTSSRRAFDRLAGDLTRVLDRRFVALVASGAASSVAFASAIHPGDLDALGALADTWHRDGLETPLLLTSDEFRRSLDAFPLEYQALIDHHVTIAGIPPFAEASVPRESLRHACEAAAKGHLLHVRQGWIEAAGHDEALARLLAESAPPLRALLGNVAHLQQGGADADPAAAAIAGARLAGLDAELVSSILALETRPDHAVRLTARLGDYLALAHTLWTFVDEWRP